VEERNQGRHGRSSRADRSGKHVDRGDQVFSGDDANVKDRISEL